MQVDDKYQYGCESKDSRVHGWISAVPGPDPDPPIGLWHISPTEEFRSGGPLKQFLTSHVGPTTLSVSPAPAPHERDESFSITLAKLKFTLMIDTDFEDSNSIIPFLTNISDECNFAFLRFFIALTTQEQIW